jgi:outer membrane protein assembly factor BamB
MPEGMLQAMVAGGGLGMLRGVSRTGIMHCLEAVTGNIVYQGQRIENGTYSASPLLAGGKIYCINEDGTTTVVKAGPAFEILGTNKLEGLTLASPVAVDNQIFIRTSDYLYCIQQQ